MSEQHDGDESLDEAPTPHDDQHDQHEHRVQDAIGAVREAAIQAEFDTGVREETIAEARSSITRRLARMTAGFIVVIVGIIMMPLPGPGLVIVAAGLAILARDFAWAERTLANVERRIPKNAAGKIPRATWIFMGVAATLSIAGSIWWNFFR